MLALMVMLLPLTERVLLECPLVESPRLPVILSSVGTVLMTRRKLSSCARGAPSVLPLTRIALGENARLVEYNATCTEESVDVLAAVLAAVTGSVSLSTPVACVVGMRFSVISWNGIAVSAMVSTASERMVRRSMPRRGEGTSPR